MGKKKKKQKGIPLSERVKNVPPKTNGEPKAFCSVVVTGNGGAVAQTTCETLEQAVALYRGLSKAMDELGQKLLDAGLTEEDLETASSEIPG